MLRRSLLPILIAALAASLLAASSYADPSTTISIGDVTVTEGDGGTVAATFTVTLNAPSTGEVTVGYASADGTAVAGADYVALTPGTVTFAPDDVSEEVTVFVNGDALDEDTETFNVNLTDPVNATIDDPKAVGMITDDDLPPTIAINDVTVTEGDAAPTSAIFTLTLSAPSGRTVMVAYATGNGQATAPDDYTATNGTLTYAPGETSKTITVTVNGDVLDEIDEQFIVNLSSPSNASFGDSVGIGMITDQDPLPALSISDATVTEGNAGTVTATFTVTLAPVSGRTVFVQYSTANVSATAGSDYGAVSATTLTFAPGETAKTVTVSVNADLLDEIDETFTVGLSGAVNATLTDATGVGTITDDDGPEISIDSQTLGEGDSGTGTLDFTVTLSAASPQAVTVDYGTSDETAVAGVDYLEASGTLTFAPGDLEEVLSVDVIGDVIDEDDETFTVDLANPVNAAIGDGQGTGTITDDDTPPTISISDRSVIEGDTGTTSALFAVSLSSASGLPVTVDYLSADGTAASPADFGAVGGELAFAPGEISKTIAVAVNGDLLDEDSETYLLNLATPTSATLADDSGVGTIIDNDGEPSVSIDDVTLTEGDSGTVSATFTATLSNATGQPASVGYATADGTATAGPDYTATGGNLVFNPGVTTRTLTVLITPDLLDEPDETFTVTLANAVNATVADASGLGTISDDDAAPAPPPPPPPPAPPPPPPPPPPRPVTRSPLTSPARGARLRTPPLLVWRAVPRARHYNVQLFRNGRKILSSWPTRPRLRLKAQWRFNGRTYRLRPASYTWIVWPNVGGRYGRALGQSSFRIVR
jgi:large repetitive protein